MRPDSTLFLLGSLVFSSCRSPESAAQLESGAMALPRAREAGARGDTHPFGIDDMLAMERVSDPQVSPDGKAVLFNLRVTDLAANKGRTDLWLVNIDGSGLRQLTQHEAADVNGRWMGDGRSIAFLSSRSGSMQVWQLPVDGGEATQLTDLALDVNTFAVFPDGKRFLLALDVYPELDTLAATAARDAEQAQSQVTGRVYSELLFRHWDGWEDGKRGHVFVWSGGKEPLDLMPGMDADAPTHPFGGAEEFAISPDGSEVLFCAKDDGSANAWTTNTVSRFAATIASRSNSSSFASSPRSRSGSATSAGARSSRSSIPRTCRRTSSSSS